VHSRSDVSEEQTFKVGGLILRPGVGNKIRRTVTTTKVGLYEINTSMEEWADDLFARISAHRDGSKPVSRDTVLTEIMKDPEWVNDDTGLIELCLRDTQTLHQRSARVVLVSADRRLANQMSNTCNVQVDRLPPPSYIVAMKDAGLDPIKDRDQALTLLRERLPARERNDPVRRIYVDTGSVAAFLTNMVETQPGLPSTLRRREVISAGVNELNHRQSKYILREIPEGIRVLRTVPVRPVLRDRRYRHSSSASRSARSGSWRTSSAGTR